MLGSAPDQGIWGSADLVVLQELIELEQLVLQLQVLQGGSSAQRDIGASAESELL